MQMKSGQFNSKPLFIVVIAIYAAVFALNWNRLHYGVEISDEAFYVAEAYIVSNGAIPYTNNWALSGATLLYGPIVTLFTTITGGTEGIFLFMRQAFLIYKLLVAGVLVLLFKRNFPFLLSLLLPLPYFALSIASVDNFSYNTLSISLLLSSCVFLFSALQDGEKYNRPFSFASGVLMALTILSHVMQLFTAAYVLVLFFILERKRFHVLSRSCFFVMGGLLTAITVTIYLSLVSGGIKPVFEGIALALQQPYFYIEKVGLAYNLSLLRRTVVIFRNFLIPGFAVFSGLFLLSYALRKRYKINLQTIYALTLLFAQIVNIILCIYRYSNYLSLSLDISICHVYVSVLLLFAVNWKKHLVLVLLMLSPFVISYLLNIPFNWTGLNSRGYLLFPSVMLSILLTYYALENASIPFLSNASKMIAVHIGAIMLTAAFCTVYIVGYYGFVYRDQPIPKLTYRMERGVFKGLHTVPERGKALIHLEDEIRKATNAQDIVLFRDQAPPAWLMTEAGHSTPSTWDILQYTYTYANRFIEGYDPTADFLLHEYFRAFGRKPNKIIYIQDRERLEHLSLWDENHKFNQYVNENFTQIYANNAERFAIIVFERNP